MKTMTKIKWFAILTLAIFVADCFNELFFLGAFTAKNILGFGFGGMGVFGYIWYSLARWFEILK